MKKLISSISLFLCCTCSILSQYIIKDVPELKILSEIPQEKVFLDHTGPLLFSGDYLYYSFGCFNTQTHNFSELSKVGYISLVNESMEIVFEQKIRLEKGISQGEFFISTDIPSGNYKLVGYTNWMKNNGLNQLFQDDLVIINPYKTDQNNLLSDKTKDDLNQELNNKNKASSLIGIKTDKNTYKTREGAKLTLTNFKQNLGHGIYTIQIKKMLQIPVQDKLDAESFQQQALEFKKRINKKIGETVYLPEQKGELLGGTLYYKDNKAIAPNIPIVVSIPGKDFDLKTATSNKDGEFFVYLDKNYEVPKAIVQAIEPSNNFEIEFKSKDNIKIDNITFNSFSLHPSFKDEILQKSIHNQIANQYFMVSPDSLYLDKEIIPYGGVKPETKVLDEFTRFATLNETIIELYHNVSYRINPDGSDFIRMEMKDGVFDGYYEAKPAIVMIDGIYIPNHEEIKDFDARKIKSIDLIRDIYRMDNKEYQGLMAIKTFEGDYYNEYFTEYGSIQEIEAPLPLKRYFKQDYGNNSSQYDRIPDYRYLLFWSPNVEIKEYETQFEFYTSDIKGTFEILVNGFTYYGKPISLKHYFSVD